MPGSWRSSSGNWIRWPVRTRCGRSRTWASTPGGEARRRPRRSSRSGVNSGWSRASTGSSDGSSAWRKAVPRTMRSRRTGSPGVAGAPSGGRGGTRTAAAPGTGARRRPARAGGRYGAPLLGGAHRRGPLPAGPRLPGGEPVDGRGGGGPDRQPPRRPAAPGSGGGSGRRRHHGIHCRSAAGGRVRVRLHGHLGRVLPSGGGALRGPGIRTLVSGAGHRARPGGAGGSPRTGTTSWWRRTCCTRRATWGNRSATAGSCSRRPECWSCWKGHRRSSGWT